MSSKNAVHAIRIASWIAAAATAAGAQEGPWRAHLASPGGELPFRLELGEEEDAWTAEIYNGPERIAVPRVEWADGELVLAMPHYDSEIRAALSEDGERMEGTWRKRRGPDAWTEMEFVAEKGEAPRFRRLPGAPRAQARLAPKFAVEFSSGEDEAVGLFQTSVSGVVQGTFLTTTGDYRFLAGALQGDRLRLSCFDGAHAFLFHATVLLDGSIRGDFWSRDSWHETFEGRPNDDVELPDMFAETSWREGAELAALILPDVDGKPRSLADPELSGKARVLQVFGTWCPNCHDETRFLVELDQEYRERGLAIVGLAFELTGELERDTQQVRRFAAHHGVEYPILIAGLADKQVATRQLPLLDRVRSYPTTIFLDAAGGVRAVHTGWTGPATGEAHDKVRAEFVALIEELLDEGPAVDFALWETLSASTWHGAPPSPVAFSNGAGGKLSATVGEGADASEHEVHLVGRAVLLDGRPRWYVDGEAGVLIDPARVAGRLSPNPDDPVPLLARLGMTSLDAVLGATRSNDPLLRREALVHLGHVTAASAEQKRQVADRIQSCFGDAEPAVRATAAWCALRLGSKAFAHPLIDLSGDVHPTVRREAVRALLPLAAAPGPARAALEALRADPDPLVRAEIDAAIPETD